MTIQIIGELTKSVSIWTYKDVITIEKTGEFFRLIYDVKGRFAIHRITAEEAQVTPPLNYLVISFINLIQFYYFYL